MNQETLKKYAHTLLKFWRKFTTRPDISYFC